MLLAGIARADDTERPPEPGALAGSPGRAETARDETARDEAARDETARDEDEHPAGAPAAGERADATSRAPEPSAPPSPEPTPNEDGAPTGPVAEEGDATPPCLRPPVRIHHLRRPDEVEELALTRCDGRPNLAALEGLSLVARAHRTPRPSPEALATFASAHPERREAWLTDVNRRLDPGLLVRLQALADRWPGRTIVIVSGHRPGARRGSRHRWGRALDLRVEGVHRAQVAAFARTLPETGVGYYPNSTFTHVDVRERATYWVDRSGPGEDPDYGPWPPTEQESDANRQELLARVEGVLGSLRDAVGGALRRRAERAPSAAAAEPTSSEPAPDDAGASEAEAAATAEAEAQDADVAALVDPRRPRSVVVMTRERTWEPQPGIDWTVPIWVETVRGQTPAN